MRSATARVLLRQAACPEVEEAELLRAELNDLDGKFLLVVVGEFNSGECVPRAQEQPVVAFFCDALANS